MGKRRPPPLLLAVAVLVLSLAAASEAAARRKSSRKLSSGNDLGGEDGVAAEDLIPIPDHYLLSDDQAATEHEDDFDDYEYDDAEAVGEEDLAVIREILGEDLKELELHKKSDSLISISSFSPKIKNRKLQKANNF